MVDKIISKLDMSKTWGVLLNQIQDIASDVLSLNEWSAYTKKANHDVQIAQDEDGVIFNGEYFDWRQFETHKVDIIKAYLRYFNESQLVKIYTAMQGGQQWID